MSDAALRNARRRREHGAIMAAVDHALAGVLRDNAELVAENDRLRAHCAQLRLNHDVVEKLTSKLAEVSTEQGKIGELLARVKTANDLRDLYQRRAVELHTLVLWIRRNTLVKNTYLDAIIEARIKEIP